MIWLVPVFLALHNAEEAVFFPRYLPFVLGRLPSGLQAVAGPVTSGQVWLALATLTLAAFGVAAWAARHPASRAALWLLLLIQAALLVNALWHVAAAVVLFGGYAPGVVTAVLLNLPFSIYLLSRARREGWLGRAALWALLPAALLVHGPLLSALLLATERL
ncbi:MAG TPA: HXXEE domain-containing protein [Gemmatimonadales bacterium]|nr:HXXEE domain-containing protein [Gemmatimonadales bacterium]